MCTLLAYSDYYETSVPPRAHRSAADLSRPGPAARHPGRPRMVPTFTSCSIGQAGTQLYPGSIATPTPQTFGVASPPLEKHGTGVGFPAKRKPRTASRPISARFEPVLRLRGVNHWFALAVPSDPASRTHTIWQYWRVPTLSELLPTLTGAPRIRLLPASTRLLRQPSGGGLPPPLEHQAPRGALCGCSRCARRDRYGC
jgi:hypothetical protein